MLQHTLRKRWGSMFAAGGTQVVAACMLTILVCVCMCAIRQSGNEESAKQYIDTSPRAGACSEGEPIGFEGAGPLRSTALRRSSS